MIVAFGTYDVQKHPRVGILIDGIRAHGVEVTELNRPLGFSTAERVRMLQQPWRLPALGWRLLTRWRQLRSDARALVEAGADISTVVVGYMGHFDVILARRLFRNSTIVLDHLIFASGTAVDRGASGLRVRLLSALDRRAIGAADIVLVDTPQHAALLPAHSRGLVVPVGARQEWFDAAPAAARSADDHELSVVFFGLYTPLQGATVIAQALRTAMDGGARIRATLVGTGQDREQAQALLPDHPAVSWVDWVESEELPALVAAHDVCLGIFGTSDKALRVVPNKVYEGAAAGCAVITSDTAPQRAMLEDAAAFSPAGDADALAATLTALAADRERVLALRAAGRERAAAFRAADVVEPLLHVLAERR